MTHRSFPWSFRTGSAGAVPLGRCDAARQHACNNPVTTTHAPISPPLHNRSINPAFIVGITIPVAGDAQTVTDADNDTAYKSRDIAAYSGIDRRLTPRVYRPGRTPWLRQPTSRRGIRP